MNIKNSLIFMLKIGIKKLKIFGGIHRYTAWMRSIGVYVLRAQWNNVGQSPPPKTQLTAAQPMLAPFGVSKAPHAGDTGTYALPVLRGVKPPACVRVPPDRKAGHTGPTLGYPWHTPKGTGRT